MIKLLLSGCCGHMGRTVTALVNSREGFEITAGVDLKEDNNLDYPVFASFDEVNVNFDVIIDFSHPTALAGLLEYVNKMHIPAVLCSTGYSDEQIEEINTSSKHCAIFRSANMSLGINLLSDICRQAAKILGDNFDIEIIEAHHNLKLDAPSGTALMLEKSIEKGLDYKPELVYDRHDRRQKRDKKEIGMHAVRGGNIVGEHQIIFAGEDEIITFSHSARSKTVFASGALDAAAFMAGKKSGLYSMKDVILSQN
ncbi:MAG: 4-hydroxy-tetrahydrodipicolinate reductase [Oscillospiraceae bacterium]|nr:4-hydroxy-tetrahydrodipicolinate reductase [Oscillospiraceae bacterium]